MLYIYDSVIKHTLDSIDIAMGPIVIDGPYIRYIYTHAVAVVFMTVC